MVKVAAAPPTVDLVPIIEVGRLMLLAEKQPVVARRSRRLAIMEETPEGSDARAWPDHDGRA